jgi:GTPase
MIQISYDPTANSLYWYAADIDEGSTDAEGECDGTILLDAEGEIIGLELELDESITPKDLALALKHPLVVFDAKQYTLTLRLFDEEPANVQPLHDTAILDFDAKGRLQGCEITAAESFGLGERLTRAAPFVIDLDDDAPDAEPSETADAADELLELAALEDQAEVDDPDTHPESEVVTAFFQNNNAGDTTAVAETPAGFRSGFVALVGPPNVGKSTLLNALLGQKVAIVSPRPQTTRHAIRGILNRPDAQIVFVDTPGIHQPRTRLGNYMVEQARRAIPDSDVVCMVVDISHAPSRLDERIAALVRRARAPKILVMNKVDQRNPDGMSYVSAYQQLADWDMELAISALRKLGLETLVDEIVARLPVERQLYPEDQVTDQTEREQAAEMVREQVLRLTQQEVPHGVAVEIEEWEQRGNATYMRMSIYVEKDSQKGILIGAGGAMLKQIGSGARQQIETLLDRTVFLDLWVKTRAHWRDDAHALHWLGYKNKG